MHAFIEIGTADKYAATAIAGIFVVYLSLHLTRSVHILYIYKW
jgi:hypothetical protein